MTNTVELKQKNEENNNLLAIISDVKSMDKNLQRDFYSKGLLESSKSKHEFLQKVKYGYLSYSENYPKHYKDILKNKLMVLQQEKNQKNLQLIEEINATLKIETQNFARLQKLSDKYYSIVIINKCLASKKLDDAKTIAPSKQPENLKAVLKTVNKPNSKVAAEFVANKKNISMFKSHSGNIKNTYSEVELIELCREKIKNDAVRKRVINRIKSMQCRSYKKSK